MFFFFLTKNPKLIFKTFFFFWGGGRRGRGPRVSDFFFTNNPSLKKIGGRGVAGEGVRLVNLSLLRIQI